jgi:hypothetical protein
MVVEWCCSGGSIAQKLEVKRVLSGMKLDSYSGENHAASLGVARLRPEAHDPGGADLALFLSVPDAGPGEQRRPRQPAELEVAAHGAQQLTVPRQRLSVAGCAKHMKRH